MTLIFGLNILIIGHSITNYATAILEDVNTILIKYFYLFLNYYISVYYITFVYSEL